MPEQTAPSAGHLLDHPRYAPFLEAGPHRLPGLRPLDPAGWLVVDPDYPAQMRERERLLAERHATVVDSLPDTAPACRELLDDALRYLQRRDDFRCGPERVIRPDGREVPIDGDAPLSTLGRLFAEDFCLLQPAAADGPYRLTAAVLCFPAGWRLADKLGRPLTAIHDPVPHYDAPLAARVDRVFASLRVGRPAWRSNWLLRPTATLFETPGGRRTPDADRDWRRYFLRTERQTLLRLPRSGAVVFGIKTSICPLGALDDGALRALYRALLALGGDAKRYTASGAGYDAVARQLGALPAVRATG